MLWFSGAPYRIGDDLCFLLKKDANITEVPNDRFKRGLMVRIQDCLFTFELHLNL